MSKLAHSNQETMDQIERQASEDLERGAPDEPPEQQNAASGKTTEIVFERSKESSGYPDPLILDLNDLSDRELASYIAASGFEYDGMGPTLREALVRLLRRPTPMGF